MKVVQAEEIDGQIQAVVEFPDGFRQTVFVPLWANNGNIKAEAARSRKQVEDRESNKVRRSDLED